MTRKRKEGWSTRPLDDDLHRYVVDQDNVLVADCYPDAWDDYGLPSVSQAIARAKRIALLPKLEALLIRLEADTPWGTFTPAERQLIGRIEKWRKKSGE